MIHDAAKQGQKYLESMMIAALKGHVPTEEQQYGMNAAKLTIGIAQYIEGAICTNTTQN